MRHNNNKQAQTSRTPLWYINHKPANSVAE